MCINVCSTCLWACAYVLSYIVLFDAMSLFAAHFVLRLPVIETWEAMWQKKYQFFGFMVYGMVSMGVIGVCIHMLFLRMFLFCLVC